MKKLIVLLIMMCGFAPVLWAADGCQQHLSPTEFRAKQQAYITEKAGLTKEEAAKFFPLYFELQDKKKEQNARIASDRLDKTYFVRFKKILSAKKLYLVQKAEMRFHRELLKGMRHNDNKGKAPKRQPDKR